MSNEQKYSTSSLTGARRLKQSSKFDLVLAYHDCEVPYEQQSSRTDMVHSIKTGVISHSGIIM
jgi:hypothetical protein